MCEDVIVHYLNGREVVCGTQFELNKEMVNGIVLEDITKWRSGADLLDYGFCWECCLCPIDLVETAKRNSFVCSKTDKCMAGTPFEYDSFDTHFYEVKRPEPENYRSYLTKELTNEEAWEHDQHMLALDCRIKFRNRWLQMPDENLSDMLDACK